MAGDLIGSEAADPTVPAGIHDGADSGRRAQTWLRSILIALPILAAAGLLVLHAITLVRYTTDLPYEDDWFPYYLGRVGSFDPRYLLAPINGSMWVVAKFTGSVVQTLLGGNSVIYQLSTLLLLLGALLLLQWRLLRLSLRDALLAAFAFWLVLPMLEVGHYWGLADLAYQQGVPLAALLAALWFVLCPAQPGRVALVLVLMFGTLAGLAYIAGAFAAVAIAIVLGVVAWRASGADRPRLLGGSLALGAVGVVTSVMHVVLVAGTSGAQLTVWPWQLDYWAYWLGVISGSLAIPSYAPGSPLAWVAIGLGIIMSALLVASILWSLRNVWRWRQHGLDAGRIWIVMLATGAMTAVYLVGVTAARAHFGLGDEPTLWSVVNNGATGHHSFWPVVAWPWVGATIIVFIRGRRAVSTGRAVPASGAVMVTLALAVLLVSQATGSWDYGRWFSGVSALRQNVLDCIRVRLDRGEPLRCLNDRDWDLTEAVLTAMSSGASFARYTQLLPADPSVPSLARLTDDPAQALLQVAQGVTRSPDGWSLAPGTSIVPLVSGEPDKLKACQLLEVRATVRSPGREVMSTSSASSVGDRQITPFVIGLPTDGAWVDASMFLYGPNGFQDDLTLRITGGPADLQEVTTICRMPLLSG